MAVICQQPDGGCVSPNETTRSSNSIRTPYELTTHCGLSQTRSLSGDSWSSPGYGPLTSYDAKSGKLLIDRERIGVTSQFMASPVAAGENIYAASLPGKIAVIKAADALEVLAVNDLKEQITATPALLDGKLYVRTANHLVAFGAGKL
jgi:hypothetical protein